MGASCSKEKTETKPHQKPSEAMPGSSKPKIDDTKKAEETKPGQKAEETKPEQKAEETKPEEQKKPEVGWEKPGEAQPAVGEAAGDSAAKPAPPGVVTRGDIRKMSREELDRFFAAVDKMMEGENGTSDFFRCASYHGEPAPYYCQHGRETFPGWHRIYLMDFEKALQKADRALGGDGKISLPYWDWGADRDRGLPDEVRERFTGWPAGFWPESLRGHRMTQRLRRASQRQIESMIDAWQVSQQAKDMMLATEHWAFASTRHGGGAFPSIETPHNSIHVIVGGNGGNMGSVAWAAYDIAFWLHHCNVDRLYEAYLRIEPDSAEEFENFQNTQDVDRFDQPFEPFRKDDGTPYYPRDTFDTKALGYEYDSLPSAPDQQLREPPTVVLFSDVRVQEFESKCYQVHVFLHPKGSPIDPPKTYEEIDFTSPNYAGGVGVFGRGSECENCLSRPPQDLIVEVTATLRRLGKSRHDVEPLVLVLETTEDQPDLIPLSSTPLPKPVITGPLFENAMGVLRKDDEHNDPFEVAAVQKYLKKYGYLAECDGTFSQETEEAVKRYQEAVGELEVDGVVGPLTKATMVKKKRCENLDLGDELSEAPEGYRKPESMTYWVGRQPGYLKREEVLACIESVCRQFEPTIHFTRMDSPDKAAIQFRWIRFPSDADVLRFDGPGGVLGRGGKGFVEFDFEERWAIGMGSDPVPLSDLIDPTTYFRGKPVVSLYHTALHELGHALGLAHSKSPGDVMAPYYNPSVSELTENDRQRLREIWGN